MSSSSAEDLWITIFMELNPLIQSSYPKQMFTRPNEQMQTDWQKLYAQAVQELESIGIRFINVVQINIFHCAVNGMAISRLLLPFAYDLDETDTVLSESKKLIRRSSFVQKIVLFLYTVDGRRECLGAERAGENSAV